MPDAFDLAIVGGGPVGMLCAALGAQAGFSIALIEATPVPASTGATDPGRDPRSYALTLASAHILDAAGAWRGILDRRRGRVARMEVRDAAGCGRVRFDAGAIGESLLSHIVEHRVLCDALAERLAALPAVRWLRPEVIAGCAAIDAGAARGMRLRCAGGRTIDAKVVIGADGARSPLQKLLGITPQVNAYDQRALVATVRFERAHGDCARQRFLATGPIALLPLDEPNTCALVWSLATEQALRFEAVGDDEFAAAIEDASERVLGRVTALSGRAAYPLVRQHLREYVREGVAFVGDAAHVIHPLAGQGLNLGLLDAAALLEVLAATPPGRPLGARATLRRYERWRKGENLIVQWAMDGLHRLFATTAAPVVLVRTAGLLATDASGVLKHWLMRRAMGLTGDLPAIARQGVAPSSG